MSPFQKAQINDAKFHSKLASKSTLIFRVFMRILQNFNRLNSYLMKAAQVTIICLFCSALKLGIVLGRELPRFNRHVSHNQ